MLAQCPLLWVRVSGKQNLRLCEVCKQKVYLGALSGTTPKKNKGSRPGQTEKVTWDEIAQRLQLVPQEALEPGWLFRVAPVVAS